MVIILQHSEIDGVQLLTTLMLFSSIQINKIMVYAMKWNSLGLATCYTTLLVASGRLCSIIFLFRELLNTTFYRTDIAVIATSDKLIQWLKK